MSINSYLTNIANRLVLDEEEKKSILKSLGAIETRVDRYFSNQLIQHFTFGSYKRGTILPRWADEGSDVDYMVVFSNLNNYKPQTFLTYWVFWV